MNAQTFTILNRRNLRSILAESRNEELVRSLEDLPTETRRRIQRFERAEGVIFGELFDDRESGDVIVSVTLETFDAVKRWKHTASLRRGLIHDYASRERVMRALVTRSGGVNDLSKLGSPSDPEQPGTAPESPQSTMRLMGIWQGTISHPTAGAKTYRARLEIGTVKKGAESGWSEYPEVRCGGKLIYRGLNGTTHEFAEVITHGNCRSGSVLLTTDGEKLTYRWGSQSGIEAAGDLIRMRRTP